LGPGTGGLLPGIHPQPECRKARRNGRAKLCLQPSGSWGKCIGASCLLHFARALAPVPCPSRILIVPLHNKLGARLVLAGCESCSSAGRRLSARGLYAARPTYHSARHGGLVEPPARPAVHGRWSQSAGAAGSPCGRSLPASRCIRRAAGLPMASLIRHHHPICQLSGSRSPHSYSAYRGHW
jgi:hypothetical protein